MDQTLKTIRLLRGFSRPVRTKRAVRPLSAQTIKEVAGKLKERRNISEIESQEIVQDVLDIVQEALVNGDEVMFRGFGKFTCKDQGKKEFRNPRTGEKIVKDSSFKLSFKPASSLKQKIEEKSLAAKEK